MQDAPSTNEPYVPAPNVERERSTAALGYFLWPLAVPVIADAGPVPRSKWAKHHARRALIFGLVTTLILLLVFSLPLMLIMIAGISLDHTLIVYGLGFFLDIAAIAAIVAAAVVESRRAARGD